MSVGLNLPAAQDAIKLLQGRNLWNQSPDDPEAQAAAALPTPLTAAQWAAMVPHADPNAAAPPTIPPGTPAPSTPDGFPAIPPNVLADMAKQFGGMQPGADADGFSPLTLSPLNPGSLSNGGTSPSNLPATPPGLGSFPTLPRANGTATPLGAGVPQLPPDMEAIRSEAAIGSDLGLQQMRNVNAVLRGGPGSATGATDGRTPLTPNQGAVTPGGIPLMAGGNPANPGSLQTTLGGNWRQNVPAPDDAAWAKIVANMNQTPQARGMGNIPANPDQILLANGMKSAPVGGTPGTQMTPQDLQSPAWQHVVQMAQAKELARAGRLNGGGPNFGESYVLNQAMQPGAMGQGGGPNMALAMINPHLFGQLQGANLAQQDMNLRSREADARLAMSGQQMHMAYGQMFQKAKEMNPLMTDEQIKAELAHQGFPEPPGAASVQVPGSVRGNVVPPPPQPAGDIGNGLTQAGIMKQNPAMTAEEKLTRIMSMPEATNPAQLKQLLTASGISGNELQQIYDQNSHENQGLLRDLGDQFASPQAVQNRQATLKKVEQARSALGLPPTVPSNPLTRIGHRALWWW